MSSTIYGMQASGQIYPLHSYIDYTDEWQVAALHQLPDTPLSPSSFSSQPPSHLRSQLKLAGKQACYQPTEGSTHWPPTRIAWLLALSSLPMLSTFLKPSEKPSLFTLAVPDEVVLFKNNS